MPKNGKLQVKKVVLTVWIDEDLRSHGQAAVKIAGYNDMTDFVEKKLHEVIEQAQKQFATK